MDNHTTLLEWLISIIRSGIPYLDCTITSLMGQNISSNVFLYRPHLPITSHSSSMWSRSSNVLADSISLMFLHYLYPVSLLFQNVASVKSPTKYWEDRMHHLHIWHKPLSFAASIWVCCHWLRTKPESYLPTDRMLVQQLKTFGPLLPFLMFMYQNQRLLPHSVISFITIYLTHFLAKVPSFVYQYALNLLDIINNWTFTAHWHNSKYLQYSE